MSLDFQPETKFDKETDFNKVILRRTSNYYTAKKKLLMTIEEGLDCDAVITIEGQIIKCNKGDLEIYTKEPAKFRELNYKESLFLSLYVIVNELFKLKAVKTAYKDKKIKLIEENNLNELLKQIVSVKSYGDTNEQARKSAYDFYNSVYTKKININVNSLKNDVKVLTIFTTYLNISTNWTADEIDNLTEELWDK